MAEPKHLAEIRELLRSREQLFARGWSDRTIANAIRRGEVLKLSRVRYIRRDAWEGLWPEEKLLARVVANAPLRRGGGYYCFESAAVLHSLPLYGLRDQRAQLLVPDAKSVGNSSALEKHVGEVEDGDTEQLHGMPSTSLERTLCDLARLSPRGRALGCLDHALRSLFPGRRGETITADAADWLYAIRERLDRDRGRRGRQRALHLLSIVDSGAESVYESVARLMLIDLGYRVRTQVKVSIGGGRYFYPDLELEGLDIFVEIDGRTKYTDERLLQQKSPQEVVVAEKRREDLTRGAISHRFVRLMPPDLADLNTLMRVLRSFNVPLPSD